MKRAPFSFVLIALLALAGCSADPTEGIRFKAERAIWQANWERSSLGVKPGLVSEDQWRTLAQRFESIADEYGIVDASAAESPTSRQVQVIAAQALFSASQLYAAIGDSARVDEVFARMSREHNHLPEVASEVGLARAGIAESRGQIDEAIEIYQQVVDRVEPKLGANNAEAAVLGIPLRIARLRTSQLDSLAREEVYEQFTDATAYYDDLIENSPDPAVRAEARAQRIQADMDLGRWNEASEQLRQLEAELLLLEDPPRDPARIRFDLASTISRSGAPPESVWVVLESLLVEYPDSDIRVDAKVAMALNAEARGEIDEAVEYLDRARRDDKAHDEFAARALFMRGLLLARNDRWTDALESFRRVPAEYPATESALQVPLEIAGHYVKLNDEAQSARYLTEAEREYRGFIDRYPASPITLFAQDRLIQVLTIQNKTSEVVDEMVKLGESLAGSPQGAAVLVQAAQVAHSQLDSPQRAVEILDRVGQLYADQEVGKRAIAEADRIR